MSDETKLLVPEPFFEGMREVAGRATPMMGDVLARYMAVAYLEDGDIKRTICYLLTQEGGAEAARHIMRKRAHATRQDSITVPRQIAEDMAAGMPGAEVNAKAYRYIYERWFYTHPDLVPKDNPHWTLLPLAVTPKESPEEEADRQKWEQSESRAAESIFDDPLIGNGCRPAE